MNLSGKRVLITGGTGSLGRALIKRIVDQQWDTDVIIFSRDETKQSQLRSRYPEYQYILGDVSRAADVRRAFRGVDVVFHFAAYKQVPSAQNNVVATLETNIIGSQNVVDAALDTGVSQVVASSTDKACQPVNFYGVSKAAMESLFQNANKYKSTTFHIARYGNVIMSNASVAPLFERQAKMGGPVTLTHEQMTRFWITIDDAVDLVLHSLDQKPGTIVVPKAGAMSVMEVALAIISMHPHKEIPIEVCGIRAGEKIHESMVQVAESFYVWQDDAHFYINPPTSEVINTEYFSYSSDSAPKLSRDYIVSAINDYHSKYE